MLEAVFNLQYHINWAQWLVPGISTFGRQRQGDQQFKIILDYIGSSKPTWAMRDPVSLKKEERS